MQISATHPSFKIAESEENMKALMFPPPRTAKASMMAFVVFAILILSAASATKADVSGKEKGEKEEAFNMRVLGKLVEFV